jgi:iduronate 2-sulfatase
MKIIPFLLSSIPLWLCPQSFAEQPNVVVIVVDDLNPMLGAYGYSHMVTPNFDRLADEGVLFERAYVQQPVCSASRASFLTGLRPETVGVDYPYSEYFVDEILRQFPTMSEYFEQHGFVAQNFGKVHHGKDLDDLQTKYFPGNAQHYFNPENAEFARKSSGGSPFEASETGIDVHGDAIVAKKAMESMEQAVKRDKPIFFMIGFRKPHLPFVAPAKFFDLYPVDQVPLPVSPLHPIGAPDWTVDRYVLNQYEWEHADEDRPFSATYTQQARQAYFACVSFIDHLIGEVVQQTKELGIYDKTIFLITSDHGFHLGDQNHWSKTTNYEASLHVPFLISGGALAQRGLRSEAFVELVDMFPTLAEMAGLPVPEHLEGTSLVPLLENPDQPWKAAAFSRQPRGMLSDRCGYAIRTDRFRYVEWRTEATGEVIFQELYDYKMDPREIENLVYLPQYAKVVKELAAQLAGGWRAALPDGIVNPSRNPVAPPPFATKNEGKSRREAWVRRFGGTVDMDWREAARLRREVESQSKQ